MVHRAPLQFIVLLLGFSFVLSTAAIPITRSLLSNREESSKIQTRTIQGDWEFRNGEEVFDMGVEGRMDLESADYAGTGANNHHDPRTPGRV